MEPEHIGKELPWSSAFLEAVAAALLATATPGSLGVGVTVSADRGPGTNRGGKEPRFDRATGLT